MAETTFTNHRFVVKDLESGNFFLVLEPAGPELEIFKGGFVSFDLREGLTLHEAENFANLLNETIVRTAYTSLEDNDHPSPSAFRA